jgi:hypothetical protein
MEAQIGGALFRLAINPSSLINPYVCFLSKVTLDFPNPQIEGLCFLYTEKSIHYGSHELLACSDLLDAPFFDTSSPSILPTVANKRHFIC